MATEREKEWDKLNVAEFPLLKGFASLPLQEASDMFREPELSAEAAQTAVTESRNAIAAKTTELKGRDETVSKAVPEDFAFFSERTNVAATKLSSFKE